MATYTKRTDDEKRALLVEWRASGASRTAFCKAQGISWKTLGDWSARLDAPDSTVPTSFADVEVVPDPAAWPLVLELAGSGHRVHVPPAFDVASLRRLVGALC